MPRGGPADNFRRIPMPEVAVDTMPPAVRTAWKKVTALYDQWTEARTAAGAAEEAARQAPRTDRQAAADATEQGKPILPPTVDSGRWRSRRHDAPNVL